MALRMHDIISIEKPRHVKVEISKGSIGANGPVFIPSIAEDNTLSWTNTGGYDNPPAVNLAQLMGSISNQEIYNMLLK